MPFSIDMWNPATFASFYDPNGIVAGTDPGFAPRNWGSGGNLPLGFVPAYYFNGINTGGTFWTNSGSVSGTNLVPFSFTSDDLSAATTWNPADKSATVTLSNGNNTAAASSGTDIGVRSVASYANTLGKVFWEINMGAGSWGSDRGYGLSNSGVSLTSLANSATGGAMCYATNFWLNGSNAHVGGCPGNGATNITIMVAVDLNAKLWWAQASNNPGQWNVQTGTGTANPAAGTGGWSFAGLNSTLFLASTFQNSSDAPQTLNTAGPYVLTPPAGFSPVAGSSGLSATSNGNAGLIPSSGSYTAVGIHLGRNQAGAINLPAGSLDSRAGLITGWIDPNGMRTKPPYGISSPVYPNSGSPISILKPYAGGAFSNVQGLLLNVTDSTMVPGGSGVLNMMAAFHNIPIAGGGVLPEFRIWGPWLASPFPLYGFPFALQWDFSGPTWYAQWIYALLGRADGTYHKSSFTKAANAAGADLTTGIPGQAAVGAPMDPSFRLFNSSDLSHPMVMYVNSGSQAWMASDWADSGAPLAAASQPTQQSVYPPGTDVGFGAGLSPYRKVAYVYDTQFSQLMFTPIPGTFGGGFGSAVQFVIM